MNEQVGFGLRAVARASITGENAALKELLEAAFDKIGDEIFSEFEEEWIADNLTKLRRDGDKYDYSTARRDMANGIERKMKKEGLI